MLRDGDMRETLEELQRQKRQQKKKVVVLHLEFNDAKTEKRDNLIGKDDEFRFSLTNNRSRSLNRWWFASRRDELRPARLYEVRITLVAFKGVNIFSL